jgi:hypothetical protein
LDKWSDLKRSIVSDGIVLYDKFSLDTKHEKALTLLTWGGIKPDSKRVLLDKRLFGYTHSGKKYSGLVAKFNGIKLKNSVLVPIESAKEFISIFKKMGIAVEIRELCEF